MNPLNITTLTDKMTLWVDVIEAYPNKTWDWRFISRHSHITPSRLSKFKEHFIWGEHGLSSNPFLKITMIQKHLRMGWDWASISDNPMLTDTVFAKCAMKYPWVMKNVSRNPSITIRSVNSFPSLEWDFAELSSKRSITPRFMYRFITKDWDIAKINKNPTIDIDFVLGLVAVMKEDSSKVGGLIHAVKEETDESRKVCVLLAALRKMLLFDKDKKNKKVKRKTIKEAVESSPYKPFVWFEEKDKEKEGLIQKFMGLDGTRLEEVLIMSHKHMDAFHYISFHPQLKLIHIKRHVQQEWNWWALSMNPIITQDFVKKNMDKNWNYGKFGLSANPQIGVGFVKDNLDKPWCFGENGLSCNPNITLEFIKEFEKKGWDTYSLIMNDFSMTGPLKYRNKHIFEDY